MLNPTKTMPLVLSRLGTQTIVCQMTVCHGSELADAYLPLENDEDALQLFYRKAEAFVEYGFYMAHSSSNVGTRRDLLLGNTIDIYQLVRKMAHIAADAQTKEGHILTRFFIIIENGELNFTYQAILSGKEEPLSLIGTISTVGMRTLAVQTEPKTATDEYRFSFTVEFPNSDDTLEDRISYYTNTSVEAFIKYISYVDTFFKRAAKHLLTRHQHKLIGKGSSISEVTKFKVQEFPIDIPHFTEIFREALSEPLERRKSFGKQKDQISSETVICEIKLLIAKSQTDVDQIVVLSEIASIASETATGESLFKSYWTTAISAEPSRITELNNDNANHDAALILPSSNIILPN